MLSGQFEVQKPGRDKIQTGSSKELCLRWMNLGRKQKFWKLTVLSTAVLSSEIQTPSSTVCPFSWQAHLGSPNVLMNGFIKSLIRPLITSYTLAPH